MAMIDCGASNNFINTTFFQQLKIPAIPRDTPLPVNVVDGRPISSGDITHHTPPVQLQIRDHHESLVLDITCLGDHPVILGRSWLSKHNPSIDWIHPSVAFASKHCAEECGKPSSIPVPCFHPAPVPSNLASKRAPDTLPNSPVSSTKFPVPSTDLPVSRLSSRHPVPMHAQISLVSGPRFRATMKTASVYGITTLAQVSDLINSAGRVDPPPAEDDDYKIPDNKTIQQLVPPEFHDFLEVFNKDNSDKLPDHGPYDHAIELIGDDQPKFGTIYSLSEVELKVLYEYIQENLKKGFISPSSSPAGSPILFVKKADGTLRLCVDYRELNKITRKNRYPLPLIQESLDRLCEAKYFSKIDLRAAYNLIRIKKGDEWKTAFRTRYGLFEYNVMPFGLTNAPASFQNLINDVLHDYLDLFVIVYLDDILIFSKTHEEHVHHVKQVLQRLRDHSLWAKAEKCEFFKHSVDFLGYIVSDKGISMDPKKVDTITSWPIPRTIRDIQSFLGFANFYRRFIKNYSKVTSPLTNLLRKDTKFEWSTQANSAFEYLKTAFTTAPILQHFQPGLPIVIETDASDYAIAGILSHSIDNKLYPIAYYSRKLSDPELNYEIYDKEMLAIVEAFKHWRAYLEGSPDIIVYTDHKNLEYFTTSKVLNRRQARWAELLAHFDFKIVYRSGSKMGKPDALTRRQDLQGGSRAAEAPPRTLIKPHQYMIANTRAIPETPRNSTPCPDPVPESSTSSTSPSPDFTEFPDSSQSDLIETIKTLQHQDPDLSETIRLIQNPQLQRTPKQSRDLEPFSLDNDILYFANLVYVPDNLPLKTKLVHQVHNPPTAGHLGQAKTYELLSRHYYFPGLRTFVNTYVNGCHTCARNKSQRHKPHGPLQSLPIPQRPWQSISMDAIIKLPVSNGYDAIMVFVDRFSKQAHFVPYKEKGFDAPELAKMFRQNIVRLHGLPTDIVSDRGTIFNSQFWKAFLQGLSTKPNFSTAFHPQTDGQTERVNQVLEQYLRHYIKHDQSNWSDMLDLAEFAYNNSVHASTKFTPFQVNYGFHPFDPSTPPDCKVPAASSTLEHLKTIHSQLIKNLQLAQADQAKFYDRHVKDIPAFKVHKKVFLNRKFIETTRPTKKLDQKAFGPFEIIGTTPSPLAFKLDLPPSMKIHPVFHVSLLEPVKPGHPDQPQDPPPRIEIDGQEEYIIDRILDSRINPEDDGYDYLVRWKDYTPAHDSWEPWEEVHNTAPFRSFRKENIKDPKHKFPSSSSRTRSSPVPSSQSQSSPTFTSSSRNEPTSQATQPRRSSRLVSHLVGTRP